MNILPIQQGPGVQQVMGQQPGQPPQQQLQSQMPQQHSQDIKLDNISKVKSLIGQLRESLAGPGVQQVMGQQPGQPPQQLQSQMPQQHSQDIKLDNISKVKSLIGQLRESLAVTLKNAAHALHQNSQVDIGTVKSVDMPPPPRFDKKMEEFYSICDQIELHLKTSIECMNQGSSSQRYLPLAVTPTRTEPIPNQDLSSLTYPQYLSTVRAQVIYAKEVHDMLIVAAQSISTADS